MSEFPTNMNDLTKEKIFLVFNTACFGDVLACNGLVQNIKRIYPDSKTIFICDKKFYDAAKYQKDVDDVVVYDKKGEHKGIKGIMKFVKEFPYKNPFASFITYPNIRNNLIAKLVGSRKIICGKSFLKSKLSTQMQHINLLKKITKQELINVPVEYSASDDIPKHLDNLIKKNEKYIGLCAITKNPPKDIPIETAIDLIKEFNRNNEYKVILFGVGEKNKQYSEQLRTAGCEFIDLIDKTSIVELAQMLKNCSALISADTGTMHLGYALKVPTLAVFYEKITLNNWSPNPKLYNTVTLCSNQTAQNIYSSCQLLLENKNASKVSVVIPTLQKNVDLLINLLKILEQDSSVGEIILIDNSCKGLNYYSPKLKVVTPNENLYVNPAWNLGVKLAENDIVALLNDDITVAPDFCSKVSSQMTPKMGAVGASFNYIKETEDIAYSVEPSELELKPIDLITYHWGITIFFYKSSYIEIPNEIKIYRGDDWIFYQNKDINRQNYYIEGQIIYHYGSLTSKSKKLRPIQKRDRSYYKKYTKKWYQHYFDLEELYDGYRITFFGIKTLYRP